MNRSPFWRGKRSHGLSPHELIGHTGDTSVEIAQIHLFIPESKTQTRTYVLMYGILKNPAFKALGLKFLNLAKIVVEQDADILRKIYPNTPQKIKLNNEVGMDWVRRNFEKWPEVVEPNYSNYCIQ